MTVNAPFFQLFNKVSSVGEACVEEHLRYLVHWKLAQIVTKSDLIGEDDYINAMRENIIL